MKGLGTGKRVRCVAVCVSAKALQAKHRRVRRDAAVRRARLPGLAALGLEALALAWRQGAARRAVVLAVLLHSGRGVVA